MDKDRAYRKYDFDLINKEDCFADLTDNKFDLSQFSGLPRSSKIFYKANSEPSISIFKISM